MRHMTTSIKRLIVFVILLLGFNTSEACKLKLKIFYAPASLMTIIDITPQFFDRGFIDVDSIFVESDMECSKFLKAITSLKKTNKVHPDVRAKIIFYSNEKIFDTFYLGKFYLYHRGDTYEINNEFRNKVNTLIKKGGKPAMY